MATLYDAPALVIGKVESFGQAVILPAEATCLRGPDALGNRCGGQSMNRSESLIAARIYFLERELERMSCAADTTEDELRAKPMDAATVRKLGAFYVLVRRDLGAHPGAAGAAERRAFGHLLQPPPGRARRGGLAARPGLGLLPYGVAHAMHP